MTAITTGCPRMVGRGHATAQWAFTHCSSATGFLDPYRERRCQSEAFWDGAKFPGAKSAPGQSCRLRFFNDLQARGERLKPPKSYKTFLFVDRIVDRLFDLAALGNDRHL